MYPCLTIILLYIASLFVKNALIMQHTLQKKKPNEKKWSAQLNENRCTHGEPLKVYQKAPLSCCNTEGIKIHVNKLVYRQKPTLSQKYTAVIHQMQIALKEDHRRVYLKKKSCSVPNVWSFPLKPTSKSLLDSI